MNVEESWMNDLLKLASADGLELVDRSECVNESGSGDWSESESGDWSECADGLEAGMDESEGEKSSGADESEKSQSADEIGSEGSPSDGMDGSEDEDSEDMDGSKASIDESEREKSSNADESEQSQSADELEAEVVRRQMVWDGSQDEFEREKFSNADESELLQSADELEAEGSPSDGMDGSQDEQSKDMDGLKPSTDESEREKSSNADDSEQSQSADELEAEGSPSDGIDGSEDEDSEDMDGSEPSMEEMVVNFHCMDESEGEESSNADESMLSESADELEAEGSPSDGMDGSEDEDSEDMDGSEPSMEEMMVDFESEQDSMKSSMNKWYDGVEVIDLTGVDDGNLPVPQITTARKKEDYVWAGEADANDVVEIEKMLLRGSGVYGSIDCKLEVRPSLLQNAGRGVFIKDNCTIHHGECITEYSGKHIKSTKRRSVEQQLRIMHIGSVMILGAVQLTEGDGFGSLINSSVNGRTLSFCRLVSYSERIFVMAHVVKKQYPLRGRIELYITVGQAWWNMFNDLNRK